MNALSNRRMTRRRFLGAAAGAVAAPYVLTSSALGADGKPPASERIAMGFIGVGSMGGGHVRSFTSFGQVQSVAVCDVDARHRDGARKTIESRYASTKRDGKYKGCDAYADFRELLARNDIDAVCIAVPDHWHAIIAIEAARAGKDIYCEKPLSLTIHEARQMVKAARRYGRVFQTGSQQRSGYNGRFRFACELVRNGYIGDLKSITVGVGDGSRPCRLGAEDTPDWIDWDMWLGPAPWRPYNKLLHPYKWRSWRDYSGGNITDWGAHHFDIIQWALDMDESGPVEFLPAEPAKMLPLRYRYANGVEVRHVGWSGPRFIGTRGEVHVDRGNLTTKPEGLANVKIAPTEVRLRRVRSHRDDFLECIRTRSRPICDVETGCRSVTVCHAVNICKWLGRPLRWDPANEVFVGDEEANRMRTRAKREPWKT